MYEIQYKRSNGEWVQYGEERGLIFHHYNKARSTAYHLKRVSHVIIRIIEIDRPSELETLGPQRVNWKKEGF